MNTDEVLETEWPSKEEREQDARFRTYLNYVCVLSQALQDAYNEPSVLLRKVLNSTPYQHIQGGQCEGVSSVERLLRNAWLTEIQLHLSPQHDELLPYSTHWAPVQLYYAVYLASRGFLSASNQNVGPKHAHTLAALSNELSNRGHLFPLPWRALCTGDPDASSIGYLNLPQTVSVDQVSPLTAAWRVGFWDSFCMFLRTTRRRQIAKRIEEWKRQHRRRRIKAAERATVVASLAPTSLFDSLYRLRVRSNYADADAALWALSSLDDAKAFSVAVRAIAWHTLLVLEALTARYLGEARYQKIVKEFSRQDVAAQSGNLAAKRWQKIREACVSMRSNAGL